MKRVAASLIAGVVIVASADAGTANSKALDNFDRTGEAVNCVDSRSVDITPVGERTLLVKSGSNYFVNETHGKCARIYDKFTRIELNLFSTQICSGEILKVVHQTNGTYLGSCSFGEFEKLTKKPAAAE